MDEQHKVIIEADEPTTVEIQPASEDDRCDTCGEAARFRIVATRMSLDEPVAKPYCQLHVAEGADDLLVALAHMRRERDSLN